MTLEPLMGLHTKQSEFVSTEYVHVCSYYSGVSMWKK